jgi:hypothetical protein
MRFFNKCVHVYCNIAINVYAFIFGMMLGFRFYLSVLQSYTCTRYAPIVKLAQHVHVYTYVEFVAGFGNGVCDESCSPAGAMGCMASCRTASGRDAGFYLATCAAWNVATCRSSIGCGACLGLTTLP